jgi:hypothetical protein
MPMQNQENEPVVKSIFKKVEEQYLHLDARVIFIDGIKQDRTPESDLRDAGINYDEVLRFRDKSFESAQDAGYTMDNAGAYTINFLEAGSPKSAIFLNSYAYGIKEAEAPLLFWPIQTLLLHHELMHAQDLNQGRNFDLKARTVNLVNAEVYADTRTLRFFDNMKKVGGDVYRNLYAAGIFGREQSPIYVRIFKGITEIFPRAQLQAWSDLSPLPPLK